MHACTHQTETVNERRPSQILLWSDTIRTSLSLYCNMHTCSCLYSSISKGLRYMYTVSLLIQTSHHTTALCVYTCHVCTSECSFFSALEYSYTLMCMYVHPSTELACPYQLAERACACVFVYVCGFITDHSSPFLFPTPLTSCSCVICCMGLESIELCIQFPLYVLCVWHTVVRLYAAWAIVESWSIGSDPLQVVHITSM